MAAALAHAGLSVAVAGQPGPRAAAVAGSLPGALGVEVDVRDQESIARGVDLA